VRPSIPVYIAAVNEGMARTAGAVGRWRRLASDGDGALHRRGEAPRDRRGRGSGGRTPADVAIADWLIVAIDDDVDQAREDVKRQIAFHSTVRTYDKILDLHGFGEFAAQIRELW
jgi:hypothetical protein